MAETIRILLVEDLPTDAELVEREVRGGLPGSQILWVDNPRDYLAALNTFQPDAILSDYSLPGFDGMNALLLAMERMPETPFILVTGAMNEETAVACMKAGAWDYILKDHLQRLVPAILNSLERGRQRRARKEAEEALAASEGEYRRLSHEFQSLLDALPDSLTLMDKDLKVHWANSAALKLFGKRKEGLIGHRCFSLHSQGAEPCQDCPVTASFASGEPASLVTPTADGRIWDLRSIPLRDDHGEISRVIELGRDITEHRKLEAQLRQAQKMESVGRLAGGIAHDFNNMLTIMIGYGEQVMSQLKEENQARSDIAEMVKAARRSAELTRQLLAFSRQQAVLPQVIDLNKRINSGLKMLKRLVGEDIDLHFIPAVKLDMIYIDPGQIEQILANLTVNARDAIVGTGLIRIETGNIVLDESYCTFHEGFVPGDYVVVTFSDTGSGMDQDTQQKIFEPFFTTKEEGKGTGLGLATVYGIVKQNNGFINVYSEPGEGTTFKIYFPRHRGSAGGRKEVRMEQVSGGSETLLLVEDEGQILAMCKRLLEKQGYRVLAAGSPEEALTLSRQFAGEIHLLVSDLIMPHMNGRELYEQIHGCRPGIRLLIMSGYTADIIAKRGGLVEGDHFIQKPFTNTDFIGKVAQVLAQGQNGEGLPSGNEEGRHDG
ncbi:MAG: response regulator [Desulfobulbus sp.]|nr:MAG: response regulator [Desulfobulbus sp.]